MGSYAIKKTVKLDLSTLINIIFECLGFYSIRIRIWKCNAWKLNHIFFYNLWQLLLKKHKECLMYFWDPKLQTDASWLTNKCYNIAVLQCWSNTIICIMYVHKSIDICCTWKHLTSFDHFLPHTYKPVTVVLFTLCCAIFTVLEIFKFTFVSFVK